MNEASQVTIIKESGSSSSVLPLTKDFGLADLVAIVRRQKMLVLGTIAGVTLLTIIILYFLTPRYTAETLVMIEGRGISIVNLESVVSGLSKDAETVAGEIEVLRSRALAEKVIEKLKLYNDREFNNNPTQAKSDIDAQSRTRVNDAFHKRLDISQKGKSRVISVAFTSEDPKKAAQIANTFAELYLVEQLEAKYDATRRVTEWLNNRVSVLRQKAEESEVAIEKFRQKTGLLQGKETSLSSQQLTELNTQLIMVKAARAEAEARLEQTNALIEGAGDIESSGEVLKSGLIQNLRQQEAGIHRKLAELRTEYGERHPKVVNLKAEARSIKRKIKSEVTKITKGMNNEVAIARAREASLEESIQVLNKQIAGSSDDLVQLHVLEGEAEANRALLKTLLTRMKEASSQEDKAIQQADARIVSSAKVPSNPSFPKKLPIIALAIVGSTLIGLLLTFLFENFDQGFRSGDEIEKYSGVISLGFIPLVGSSKNPGTQLGTKPESYLKENKKSAFGQAINTLRWTINLPYPDQPPKKILFTSSKPKEGKTTIAVCFAMMQARAGKDVVLIDADCRIPTIHETLGLKKKPGLVELLAGETTLEETIQRDEEKHLDVIVAGNFSPNPIDILIDVLESDEMDDLLNRLTKLYDIIIIDSPPIMAGPDAIILSKKSDTTVFVVRWADTKREAVLRTLKQLQDSGGTLAGVLLSMVDAKKHALYSYGDSGYYSGRLEKYYGS
jgi:succinoglycan biosynthesis transport protein ExoP